MSSSTPGVVAIRPLLRNGPCYMTHDVTGSRTKQANRAADNVPGELSRFRPQSYGAWHSAPRRTLAWNAGGGGSLNDIPALGGPPFNRGCPPTMNKSCTAGALE